MSIVRSNDVSVIPSWWGVTAPPINIPDLETHRHVTTQMCAAFICLRSLPEIHRGIPGTLFTS